MFGARRSMVHMMCRPLGHRILKMDQGNACTQIHSGTVARHCRGRPLVLGRPTRPSRMWFSSGSSGGAEKIQTQSTSIGNINKAPMMGLAGGVAVVIVGVFGARLAYGHLLEDPGNEFRAPRRDGSRATVLIDTTKLMSHTKGGELVKLTHPSQLEDASFSQQDGNDDTAVGLKEVDAKEFLAFVAEQRSLLEGSRERTREAAGTILRKELRVALADAKERVPKFANWYFSYSTTYQLLGIAMACAAKHAISFHSSQTWAEAVTEELQAHVRRKYEALVLRPAITDPKVHRAFVKSLQSAHSLYLEALEDLNGSVATFVKREANVYSLKPKPDDVVVDMDWSAQMQKVQHVPLAYEKTPERTLALLGTGAAAGKMAGGAAGGAAIKALAGKMAAPFASKALGATAAKAASAGATGGMMVGGPVGAAAGAAFGIGIDMTVNAGIAMMQRPALEQDIHDSLDATVLEWEERLLPELERVHTLWFDHAQSLLDTTHHIVTK